MNKVIRLEVIKEIRRVAQAQRVNEEAAMWQVNLQQEPNAVLARPALQAATRWEEGV